MHPALLRSLGSIPAGRTVLLRRVRAGQELASRLAAMGLLPGVRVKVRRNDRHGPVIIEINGGRVILGRGMADKVSVEDGAETGA